jgi:hypothetical protein
MLKHLLLILSAVAILAADTNENTLADLDLSDGGYALLISTNEFAYELSTQDYWNSITNVTWTIDQTGTNEVSVSIGTNTTVTWLPVERSGQMQKEVGFTQTNRILTIIHQGKTNLVGIAVIGREEWPSQKRTQKIPTQPAKK